MDLWEELRRRVLERGFRTGERLELLEVLRREPNMEEAVSQRKEALLKRIREAALKVKKELQ